MRFTYTYRKADGSRGEGELEAASRSAAFGALTEKGIKPIRLDVVENAACRARPSFWRGVLAGLLTVGVALVVWHFLAPAVVPPLEEAPAPRAKTKPVARPAAASVPAESVAAKAGKKKPSRAEMLRAMSPAERLEFLFKEAEERPINLEPASNRLYATATEQVLDWVFTTRLGDMPPPLPNLPMFEEAHLAEILVNGCRVKDSDDEAVKERKEIVDLAKKEMIKFVSDGGDPAEFLKFYHDELRQAHMEYQAAQREVFQVVREEPELALDYLARVNGQLAEKGIKPVRIPPRMAERFGIDLESEGKEP